MKILVLAGGLSPERDVSLASGCLISNALLSCGYEVLLADVFSPLPADKIVFSANPEKPYSFAISTQEPDLAALRASVPGNALIGEGILDAARQADVVFLALHGGMGENGQIQAFFDVEGIRYTGSDYEGCVLAMNKHLTKRMLDAEGIRTPTGILTNRLPDNFSYPCFVKPPHGGSSIATTRADNPEALAKAIQAVRQYEPFALVEPEIRGREFSVGVLEGQALPPIEIIPTAGFYDYANKYQSGLTRELCPAPITAEEDAEMRALAVRAAAALGLRDYSRIDFILEASTGEFICLEANTLPGMTPTSLLPQEAAASGISYEALCKRIVELALRH